jgi:hypothetical protein
MYPSVGHSPPQTICSLKLWGLGVRIRIRVRISVWIRAIVLNCRPIITQYFIAYNGPTTPIERNG